MLVLIPLALAVTVSSFVFDWSWWLRCALGLLSLTLVGDLGAVQSRLKTQREKLAAP